MLQLNDKTKGKTLFHKFLDLEAGAGVGVGDDDYNALERILKSAKDGISAVEANGKSSAYAIEVLRSISQTLDDEGFRVGDFPRMINTDGAAHVGMTHKALTQSMLAGLYWSISEVADLPLSAMLLPAKKMVVTWNDGPTKLVWDHEEKVERNLEYYISKYKIGNVSIDNGVYLRNLNKEEMLSFGYANLAVNRAMRGDATQAIMRDADNAIRLNPKNPSAYVVRGSVCYEKGKLSEAFKDFDKALELDPNHTMAHYMKGMANYVSEDYESADANFSRVLEQIPNYSEAYIWKMRARVAGKSIEQALKDANDTISDDPRNPDNHYYRGMLHTENNEHESAIRDFSKAIGLDPDNPAPHISRGYAHLEMRNFNDALKDFGKGNGLDFRQEYALKGMFMASLDQSINDGYVN